MSISEFYLSSFAIVAKCKRVEQEPYPNLGHFTWNDPFYFLLLFAFSMSCMYFKNTLNYLCFIIFLENLDI